MQAFVTHDGLVAPLDQANIDTDAIIPKQFLKSIKRSGFGPNAFDEWRYLDRGEPGQDNSLRAKNPRFVLNQERYQGASVLITRANFGCGSSREHAPWALLDFGFRVIIAESFADIFFNNCFKIGLLPVVCAKRELDALFGLTEHSPGFRLRVDLPEQKLVRPDGYAIGFDIDPFRKDSLLNGWDDIGRTLRHADLIHEFEERRKAGQPWLFA